MNAPGRPNPTAASEAVVLVHGLWMSGWALGWLGQRLAAQGYRPHAFSYASMRMSLEANARALARFIETIDADVLHLVGHSMGGLVVYRALAEAGDPRPGRVVLLGSPFLDSLAGRRFGAYAVGHFLLGKSMREWLEQPASEWALTRQVGVIAGSLPLGLGHLVAPDLPQPNDGVVAVEETRAPGIADHIVLPVCHTAMIFSPGVSEQVAAFLRGGRFSRDGDGAGQSSGGA